MQETTALTCRTFVLKVASRCNLNCSYCYMYNKGDNSWRRQPKVMSEATVVQLLVRICEHYGEHKPHDHVVFAFHGGEPLLAGLDFFQMFVRKCEEILHPKGIQTFFSIQTNGILLNEEFCAFFYQHQFSIGVSLDGVKSINDTNRVYHNGKGSFDDVMAGIHQIKNYRNLADGMGFLIVINRHSNPSELYHFFKVLGAFDFLLPDYTHDEVEPEIGPGYHHYGDWLIKIFDLWFDDPQRPNIRFFNGLVQSVLGGEFSADTLGIMANDLMVIETNGGYEAVDALKICGDGFTKAGATVTTHSISEALQTDLANLYHRSHSVLAPRCEQCAIRDVCGGGYLPHRYSRENGFNNPSVYCNDLMKIITHIQNRVLALIPDDVLAQTRVEAISYEQALSSIESASRNALLHPELLRFSATNPTSL